jgi:hypothetical protein
MLLHKQAFQGTLVGGTKSWTTDKFSGKELIQLTVVPTSTYTNVYDILIVDSESDPILSYSGVEGVLVRNERIPLAGIYTILVANATIDESIRVVIRVGDGYGG